MTIIDISPPISDKTALFPGEVVLERKLQAELEKGDPVTLSSIHASVHVGAHADAPSHVEPGTPTIDQLDLTPYVGRCFVKDCSKKKSISAEDARSALKSGEKRILFRTLTHHPQKFEPDFCYFSPESIEVMGKAGVLLVGIDTPSIDSRDSKDLPAHHALVDCGMRNLENLFLENVKEGVYELVALPLKLVGFDASPVRAILMQP